MVSIQIFRDEEMRPSNIIFPSQTAIANYKATQLIVNVAPKNTIYS